jgi:hypothetical protein
MSARVDAPEASARCATPRQQARRSHWLREPGFYAALLVAGFALWARLDLIASRGTYPLHKDERHITKSAVKMLQTGDLNPHFFKYGSLPIYLTAAAMGTGAVVAKLQGSLTDVDEITSVYQPYYSHPTVSLAPRWLFAFISVVALVLVGGLARHAFGHSALWVAPPCALLCSDLFLWSSWGYLNVDVVATALCLGALLHLIVTLNSTTLLHRAIIPALFCGAVTATKINSGLLGVPFLLVILLGPREKWAAHLSWLFGLSLLAYMVCSPFTFLDHKRFLRDVLSEFAHYRNGHPGRRGEPGLWQLRYYWGVLVRDIGAELAGLGVVGVLYGIATRTRNTLLLLSLPVAMLLHMATNRTNFPRTVMPVYAVFTVFVGLGATGLVDLARRLGEHLRARIASGRGALQRISRFVAWLFAPATALALIAWLVHSGAVAQVQSAHSAQLETRLELSHWLVENAPPDCLLLVPINLPFDPRLVAERCQVRNVDLEDPIALAALRDEVRGAATGSTLLLYPRWERRGRSQTVAGANAWKQWVTQLKLSKPLFRLRGSSVAIGGSMPPKNPYVTLSSVKAWN